MSIGGCTADSALNSYVIGGNGVEILLNKEAAGQPNRPRAGYANVTAYTAGSTSAASGVLGADYTEPSK